MKATAPIAKNRLPAKAYEFMQNPEVENAEYKLIRGLFTDTELKKLGWNYNFPHPFDNALQLNAKTTNYELGTSN